MLLRLSHYDDGKEKSQSHEIILPGRAFEKMLFETDVIENDIVEVDCFGKTTN